jgi:hypothetical protein
MISWVAGVIWSADYLVAVAYVRSYTVVEVKLLSVPKSVCLRVYENFRFRASLSPFCCALRAKLRTTKKAP